MVSPFIFIYSRSDVSFTIVAMKITKTTRLTIFNLSLVLKILGDVICTSLVITFFLPQSLIQPPHLPVSRGSRCAISI